MRTLVSGLIALSMFGAAHEVHEEAAREPEGIEIKMRRPHAPHREGASRMKGKEGLGSR